MTDSAERFIRKTFRQSPSLFISLITGDTIFHATWTKTNSRNRIGTENMLHVRSLFHLLVPIEEQQHQSQTVGLRDIGNGAVSWNHPGYTLTDRTNRPADIGRSEGEAGKSRMERDGWITTCNREPKAFTSHIGRYGTRRVSPGADARCVLRQALRAREARRLKAVMVAIILYQFFIMFMDSLEEATLHMS